MALEFAIFCVEANAAAEARADLLGAMASSLVYKRTSTGAPPACLPAVLASALLLLCMVPPRAIAQQQLAVREASRSLSDLALPKTDPENSAHEISLAEGSASVAGTVLDTSGAAVPGATVSLSRQDGTELHTVVSEADGAFNFAKIHPGPYLVVVNAKGFAPFVSEEFTVAKQQAYEVPIVSLSVATASMEVMVRPIDLIAAEQIRAAEKQRLMGVIPNFYTSYISDAAPLTWKQKFSFAARGTFDPIAMIGVGFAAGVEQANDSFPGYGQGAAGYSKRYAAKFVDGRSSDLLTHAVFPSVFRQDPRYYYQGSGTIKSRLRHAVSSAFVTRSDSGRTEPNYSYLLGDTSAAALSNLYYPQANRGAHLIFANAAVGLAGRVGGNLLREFLPKRMTTNVPANREQ
jgi:Carboxypeptidase regulatory-like domain